MDTDRERAIGLMPDYRYPAMNEGECWISAEIADRLNLQRGDLFYQKFDYLQTLYALVGAYNREVPPEDQIVAEDAVQPGADT
jgi:hypothetical protein